MKMVEQARKQRRLKRLLIAINIALAAIFFSLLLYWFLGVRPKQIEQATKANHYFAYHVNSLPHLDNQIKPDYIGDINTVKHQQMVNVDIKTMTSTIDDIDLSSNKKSQADLLIGEAEKEMAKADKLIFGNKTQPPKNNRVPAEVIIKEQPKIAIILTDLGLARKNTELAMNLPRECGFGFLPQTKNLKPLIYKAKSNGHEIFMHLPMAKSDDGSVSSKYELSNKFSEEQNIARMAIVLNAHNSYNGVYSSYKEAFTDSYANAKLVAQQLDIRGLPLIYGNTESNPEVKKLLGDYKKVIPATIIIDEELDEAAILTQLGLLLKEAESTGSAIGYGQSYPLTIKILQKWLPTLDEAGTQLVPLTRIINDN